MRYREGIEESELDTELLGRLKLAEVYSREDFEVTSGYREGDERTHGLGQAVDIACSDSTLRWRIVRGLVRTNGIVRVGLYPGLSILLDPLSSTP